MTITINGVQHVLSIEEAQELLETIQNGLNEYYKNVDSSSASPE